MGVLLRWALPDSESSWDTTYIYRSSSQNGTYSTIASQVITDNTYYDEAGGTNSWYKVRFYDSTSLVYSDYSTAIQGSKVNAYCSIQDVRNITGITSSEVTDTVLFSLLEFATGQLNQEINLSINKEIVGFVDGERKNTIDGTNTIFYVKSPWIGDMDNDGRVTTSDLQVWKIDSTNTRTELTVESVDNTQTGQFTLATAPTTSDRLYVKYSSAPLDEDTPHTLIRTACAMLAGAYAFTNLEAKQIKSFRLGRLAISKQSNGYDEMMKRYFMILIKINDRLVDNIPLGDISAGLMSLY